MTERVVIHADMDAFYSSVGQRDHPEYRSKPVIVGADPKGGHGRDVVAAC
jgi:nucleotidyltransferase/DNA polymerase involved in DNA repair